MYYTVHKFHNAVGTVWWSLDENWTHNLDNVKLFSLDEAIQKFRELLYWKIDCLGIEEFDDTITFLVNFYKRGGKKHV